MTGVRRVEPGVRVEFLGFGKADPYSDLVPGTLGTVDHVDDLGTVHVKGDNGSSLGMVQRPMGRSDTGFVPDRFRVVPNE